MSTFQRILVPIDFGPASDAALDQAVLLATAFDAELMVLHVCEIPAWAYANIESSPMPDATLAIETTSRAALDARIARHVTGKVTRVVPLIRQGSPWMKIDEVARSERADLIVIGTHGSRGWLSHALIGSVAEKVVRNARIPVLTVHAPHDSTTSAATQADPITPPG